MTTTVANCPLCGDEIFRYQGWNPDIIANERQAEAHMADRHKLRYWLWRKTRWSPMIGVWR